VLALDSCPLSQPWHAILRCVSSNFASFSVPQADARRAPGTLVAPKVSNSRLQGRVELDSKRRHVLGSYKFPRKRDFPGHCI